MAEWWRSGTLIKGGVTEIDLTNGASWVTVKGATDELSEALATTLLALLNALEAAS